VTPEDQDAPDGRGPNEPAPESDDLEAALADTDPAFVTAQKKPLNKSAVMLLAVLVFGGAGTYMMYLRSGPQAARAAAPNPADTEVGSFLSDGAKNVKRMQSLLKGTQKLVDQFNHSTDVPQVPLKDLKSNPFRFAPPKPAVVQDTEEQIKQRREAERVATIKAVQSLQLQSILCSKSVQQCMINNALYAEGAEVEGFNIEKVNANSVIVRRGVFRFELGMQR
jgi:hypothetical protein